MRLISLKKVSQHIIILLALILTGCNSTDDTKKQEKSNVNKTVTKKTKYMHESVGKTITADSKLTVVSSDKKGRDVHLKLSDGSRHFLPKLQWKLDFLNQYVEGENHDTVFELMKNLIVRKDEFNNSFTIESDMSNTVLKPLMSVSFSARKNAKQLYIKYYYRGFSWIFFDKAEIKVNNKTYERVVGNASRNTRRGGVTELALRRANKDDVVMLEDIAEHGGTVRLSGKSMETQEIPSFVKRDIKSILAIYSMFKLN